MNKPLRNFRLALREIDLIAELHEIDGRRAELRRLLREHESRRTLVAFRPLPYDDPLGPTGAPKNFLQAGGGNRSGTAQPGAHTYANAGGLPSAYWDFSYAEQLRQFDNSRRQYSRIKKNGGKRKAPHRPRTIAPEQEQRVRDLLAAGVGIRKAASIVGMGVSGVQRIKREM